jgi:hypothetical protein
MPMMAMKLNLFLAAAVLAAWILLSHGAPLFPVLAGTAGVAVLGFARRAPR